jgi:hypothetical protein
MMWGAISYALKLQLVHIPDNLNAARYRDEVLTPHMLPSMNLRRGVFPHDHARSHIARATVVQTLKFIKMENFITLKSIAFR